MPFIKNYKQAMNLLNDIEKSQCQQWKFDHHCAENSYP